MNSYKADLAVDYDSGGRIVHIEASSSKEAYLKASLCVQGKEIVVQVWKEQSVVYDFMNGFFSED